MEFQIYNQKSMNKIALVGSLVISSLAYYSAAPPAQSYGTSYECPPYSTYVENNDGYGTNECVCWNHYVPDGYGNCVFVCPEGFQLDYSDLTKCKRTCPWNNWWDAEEDQCYQCPENSLFDPAYGYCRCLGGFQMVNGYCVKQCGAYEINSNGKCLCKSGYVRNVATKQCVKKVTIGAKYTAY